MKHIKHGGFLLFSGGLSLCEASLFWWLKVKVKWFTHPKGNMLRTSSRTRTFMLMNHSGYWRRRCEPTKLEGLKTNLVILVCLWILASNMESFSANLTALSLGQATNMLLPYHFCGGGGMSIVPFLMWWFQGNGVSFSHRVLFLRLRQVVNYDVPKNSKVGTVTRRQRNKDIAHGLSPAYIYIIIYIYHIIIYIYNNIYIYII